MEKSNIDENISVKSDDNEVKESSEEVNKNSDNQENLNEAVKEIIESYKKELEEVKEQRLRALAEVQNIRRISNIDIEKAKNYGIEKFSKDLLGVMDSLFMATDNIAKQNNPENKVITNILEGLEAIKKDMSLAFSKNNITRINPENEMFDHNFHQAISQAVDNQKEINTILSVMQPGYKIHNRVLRPAMVIVSKQDTETSDGSDNDNTDQES